MGYNLKTGTLFNSEATDLEPEEAPELPVSTKVTNFSYPTNQNTTRWLFNTGFIVHICNNRSLFLDLRRSKKLGVVRTGSSPIKL